MKSEHRKAAIAAYKERRNAAGIYQVRCVATGQVWVGQTPHLGTVKNRIWFTLRMGSHTNRALQGAWSARGAEHFSFEPLEWLDDEDSPYVRDALLRERVDHWRLELNAWAM